MNSKIVAFDYKNRTVTITHKEDKVIYIEVISWSTMLLRDIRGMNEAKNMV